MRVPSNRPIAYLWYLLAVVGLGGVILVAQILGLGAPRHFPSPAWLLAAGAASAFVCAIGVRGIVHINREMKAWVAGDHPWVREDVAARMGPCSPTGPTRATSGRRGRSTSTATAAARHGASR